MADLTGTIVEYLSSGNLEMGLVTAQSVSKLQLTSVHGRNLSLAPRNVVIAHPERCNLSEFPPLARELQEAIHELVEEVDTELLWESVRARERALNIQELAQEYFGESGSRQCSAVFQAVFEDRLRFKQKGLQFTPRTAEQVEEQQHAQQVRAEREAFLERREGWLNSLLDAAEPQQVPEEFRAFVSDVEALLLQQKGGEVERLLEQLNPESTAKETAFRILVKSGRLPEDADPLLIIAGIEERFPPEVLEAVSRLSGFRPEPQRIDYSELGPFSIDDPETREIDDAVTVEAFDEGCRVGIHIADASHFVPLRDRIFEEALRRGTTLYLPNRTVTMLPEVLSFDLASLQQDALRPALTVCVDFDSDDNLVDWRLQRSQLKVARRLDYDQVDEWLSGQELGDPWVEKLHTLDRITQRLLQRRVENGALLILKPELKIRVDDDGEISLKVLDKDSASRRMVSELMILANQLVANLAVREAIPLLYRTQEPPSEAIALPGHYDPVVTDQVFRKLKRSTISLEPAPHASLGLEAYVQVTSPIRRLADLACQQQLSAHLQEQPLPHAASELEEVQSAIRSSEKDLRAVERKSNRLYLLKYLDLHFRGQPLEAVVLSSSASSYQVETCELFARGRLLSPQPHAPGEHVTVRIDKVDPEDDRLVFRLWEE